MRFGPLAAARQGQFRPISLLRCRVCTRRRERHPRAPLYHARMASRRLPCLRAAVAACARRRRALAGAATAFAAAPALAPDPSWWAPNARLLKQSALPSPPGRRALRHGPGGLDTARARRGHGARRRSGRPLRRPARQHDARDAAARPSSTAQQVVLVSARAPVGSPLVHVTALGADGARARARRSAAVGELGHVRVQRGGPHAASPCGSCSIR